MVRNYYERLCGQKKDHENNGQKYLHVCILFHSRQISSSCTKNINVSSVSQVENNALRASVGFQSGNKQSVTNMNHATEKLWSGVIWCILTHKYLHNIFQQNSLNEIVFKLQLIYSIVRT